MSPHVTHHTLLHAEGTPIELSGAPIEPTTGEPIEVEHEALIGDELTERAANAQPTLATAGETPFETATDAKGNEIEEQAEYHKIVATEIVPDPILFHEPEPILQNAIVLLEPRLKECQDLVESAAKRGLFVTVVNSEVNTGEKNINYYPTAEALLEVGVHQVYEPPVGTHFNVCEAANHLITIESQQNLRYLGVIPLREAAVTYSDVLGALLGLAVHNDLGLASARRDKALMKQVVANAGLRVAKYARLTARDGSDVAGAIKDLELDFPVVVKTPRGMGTMDVFIVDTLEEAVQRSGDIVRSVGPDGTRANFSLLEEFIGGDEFAVNLVASPTTPRGVQVTDVWKYDKILTDGTNVNRWQTMVDPHSPTYAALVRYAEGICRAVGIKYGLAHVELKARYDESRDKYVDPVMIEVGARLAGGRKAIMAQETVPGWFPFDAMMDAHCGFPVRVPPSFTPAKVARHVFVPSDKNGVLAGMKGDDFDRLPTYNSHLMLCEVGKKVVRATDIMSFAAFVWLIGTKEEVERDSEIARREFVVEVEPEEQ